jgi:hypothetical protein
MDVLLEVTTDETENELPMILDTNDDIPPAVFTVMVEPVSEDRPSVVAFRVEAVKEETAKELMIIVDPDKNTAFKKDVEIEDAVKDESSAFAAIMLFV